MGLISYVQLKNKGIFSKDGSIKTYHGKRCEDDEPALFGSEWLARLPMAYFG